MSADFTTRAGSNPESRRPNPESRLPNPESRLPNPESRLPNPESRLPNPALYACLYQPPSLERASDDRALTRIAADFSPRFERHRADLVSIDVSGLERLLGPARAIGAELRRTAAERGVRVHVAIAGTRVAALVLAQAQPGLTIVEPGEEAAALAPVPVDLLGRIDDGEALAAALSAFARWGLTRLGEIAALSAADFASRLGPRARAWHAIARGVDVRPLVPLLEEERFESSLDLDWPIDGLEPLSFVLTRLLEPLSTRLERRDRGAAVLHVVLRLVTKECVTRSLLLPAPLRDVRTLRTLALLDLEAHPAGAAIDRVQIVIDPTPGRVLQHTLFTRAHPTVEQLSTLLARLGALMGQDRIGAAALVDTYRPGAFTMTPFAVDHERRPSSVREHVDRRADCSTCDAVAPLSAASPRTALTMGANVAPTGVTALRRCRQPVPARVAVDAGRPVRVTSNREGFTGGAVVTCTGPWRTSGAWWETESPRRSGGDAGGPWNRDEWDVALGDGGMYRIFHDRMRDMWFIDAIVD